MPGPILYADDSMTSQKLVEAFLSKLGFVTIAVRDGEVAVQQARAQRFHAILMDMRMPRLDGIGATQQIRALPAPFGTTPIIGLTAASETEKQRCLDAGMDMVLAKPIDFGALAGVLMRLDARRAPAAAQTLAPAAPPRAPQVIDIAWLTQVAEDVGKATLRAAMQAFQDEAPALVGAIALAAARGDRAGAAFHVQALATIAREFGGERLAAVAGQKLAGLEAATDLFAEVARPMASECAALTTLLATVFSEGTSSRTVAA